MRVVRFLRSRRLAVALLVGLTAYAWVTTLVPLQSVNPALVMQWDIEHPRLAVLVGILGLHRAYSSPVFIAAALLVTLSTAACSWERTLWALRGMRSGTTVSEATARRIKEQPSFVVGGKLTDRDQALDVAAGRLRAVGLRVRRGPSLMQGTSGHLGYLGSPLFHWALVGLFMFAGLGQLTRYEGHTNILVGTTNQDAAQSYSQNLNRGRFARPYTGVMFTLEQLDLDFSANGVARGAAPLVAVSDRGSLVRKQWVYPNRPLRYGSLLVHNVLSGPAFVGTVKVKQTGEQQRIVLYFDPENPVPGTFELPDPTTGETIKTAIAPVVGQRVSVTAQAGSKLATDVVATGEAATLADGVTLRVDRLAEYSQLKVVNDWTVPWVYVMFALICVGATISVFVSPRTVRVMAVEGAEGSMRLHVLVSQSASDPAFSGRIERLMNGAEDLPVSQKHEGTQG